MSALSPSKSRNNDRGKSLAEFAPAGANPVVICFRRRHVRRGKHFSGCKCGVCPLAADQSRARQAAAFSKKWQSRFFDSLRKKGPLALFLFVPARVLEEFFGKSKSGSPWSGEGHPAAEPRKECVWEESPGDCPCKRERRTRWALRGADCRTGSPSCSAWPGMHRPSYLPSHDTCPSAPNMPRYKSFSQNIIDI